MYSKNRRQEKKKKKKKRRCNTSVDTGSVIENTHNG
jgi:hypothetical protein